MSVITTFALGAGLGLTLSLVTVLVLRPHLANLLDEICGTRARAAFWMVTALLPLFLFGALTSTVSFGYPMAVEVAGPRALFFGLVTQLRACLFGLLAGVLVVAWLLVGSIRRYEAINGLPPSPAGGGEPAGAAGPMGAVA